MKIPDLISPVVAWRVWQLDASGLKSLSGEPWLLHSPLQAGCMISGSRCAARLPHDAPQINCSCGIYGSKNLDHLRRTQYWRYGGVHGEVKLWGSVVEHERGFRAQFAYPKTLYLSSEKLPVTLRAIQSRIQPLAKYGCDLFIDHNPSSIPLWSKRSGLDEAGLEFLINRAEDWYSQRSQERTLKVGDRVAVLGRGIALIERADEKNVFAVLWNRKRIRVNRIHVSWDEPNLRWEVSAEASVEADAVR